jgi:hypothetical protein
LYYENDALFAGNCVKSSLTLAALWTSAGLA